MCIVSSRGLSPQWCAHWALSRPASTVIFLRTFPEPADLIEQYRTALPSVALAAPFYAHAVTPRSWCSPMSAAAHVGSAVLCGSLHGSCLCSG